MPVAGRRRHLFGGRCSFLRILWARRWKGNRWRLLLVAAVPGVDAFSSAECWAGSQVWELRRLRVWEAVLRSEGGLLKSAAAHLGPRETPFAGTLSGTWHSEAGAKALLGLPHSHQQVFTYDRCCTETEEGIQARGGVAKKLSALLAFFCRKTGER